MTRERARELLNHRTRIGNVDVQTISVGDICKLMTAEEINYVNRVWDSIPWGGSSFHTALCRIASAISAKPIHINTNRS